MGPHTDRTACTRSPRAGANGYFFLIGAIVALVAGCNSGSQPAYLRSGIEKLRLGKVKVATIYLEKAAEHDPQNYSAQMHLGIALIQVASPRRAIPSFQKAAQLDAEDTRAYEYLAHAHVLLAEWDAADRALAEAESIQSTARILTARAVVALRLERLDEAASLLSRALELEESYPPALYNRALIARHWRNDAAAADAYLANFRLLDDAERVARLERAFEYFSTDAPQPPQEAPPERIEQPESTTETLQPVEDADSLVAVDSTSTLAQVEQALSRRDFDVALVTLKKLLADAPDHADAHWMLARMYDQHLNRAEEATRAYLIFADQHPEDHRAQEAVELAWDLQKRITAEEVVVESSEPETPVPSIEALEASKAAFQDGFRAYRRKEWAAAAASYRQAVEQNPGFAEGYYHLGLSHRRLGSADQARQALQAAVRLKPGMTEAHYMLAAVYREAERNELARDHLIKLLAADPHYADAHFLIGLVYRDLQEPARTQNHFEQYLRVSPEGQHAAGIRHWLKLNP